MRAFPFWNEISMFREDWHSGGRWHLAIVLICVLGRAWATLGQPHADDAGPLAVGVAGHAFDHLGGIGDQAEAAAGSGANVMYATGFGAVGYGGLPGAGVGGGGLGFKLGG